MACAPAAAPGRDGADFGTLGADHFAGGPRGAFAGLEVGPPPLASGTCRLAAGPADGSGTAAEGGGCLLGPALELATAGAPARGGLGLGRSTSSSEADVVRLAARKLPRPRPPLLPRPLVAPPRPPDRLVSSGCWLFCEACLRGLASVGTTSSSLHAVVEAQGGGGGSFGRSGDVGGLGLALWGRWRGGVRAGVWSVLRGGVRVGFGGGVFEVLELADFCAGGR